MREQTPVHAYNDGCDCCERFGQNPSTCKDRFCDACDGPCRMTPTPPVTAQESEAMAKLERDQLISGAAGYMASAGAFRHVPRAEIYDDVREDFSSCAPPVFDKAGAFTEKFKRNGPLTQEIIDRAIPAEGKGDTFIPAGKPLPVGDARLEHAEEFKFFDGSIPPGISTDPTKPVVDAMPDTPRQRVRRATVKALEAMLELNDVLESLDNYQNLTGAAA